MITVPLVLLGTSHSIRDLQQASECAARIENFLNVAQRPKPRSVRPTLSFELVENTACAQDPRYDIPCIALR